jgi:hypothetical protein
MDKQYTCFDWVNSKFDTILKKNNYICQSTLENYPTCKKIDIQLDNIEKGIYLVKFETNNETTYSKFIKE